MPLVFAPAMRKIPETTREWDEFFRGLRVTPDDGSTGTAQIANDAVTNAKLRNSGALSVIGRSTDTTGDPADISATVDATFLVRRATALGFGPLVDADIPATIARDTEVATAISDHEALADPHPGYSTTAETAAAITAHEGASNPHPTYLTQAEGDGLYQPLAAVLSMIHTGTGSPEGVLTAVVGHLYLRDDGGAGTTLYVKESGTGNTGWVGK